MRILVGMPDKNSLGGPIYCEPPFVVALRAAGVETDEEVYVYGDGGTPTSIFKRISRVLGAARRLRARTREKQYDVIHLNTSFDEKCVLRDLGTLVVLRKSGVPVYLKMHGSIAGFLKTKSRFWRLLQRRVFKMAANIGVLSHEESELFLAAGCRADKLTLVKNAFKPEEFEYDRQFRHRMNVDDETPILLFSSRLLLTKGLLDVIVACSELKKTERKFTLFCLGDGPVLAEAKELVNKLDLNDHVRFTGQISEEETTAFHANSTVFVFPTYHDEGFPLVLLKSLAAGMPIITTRIRAAADYLTEPDNCLWVKPRSPDELVRSIGRLIDEDRLRSSMSINNRRLAEKFLPEVVAREYIEIYTAILSGS